MIVLTPEQINRLIAGDVISQDGVELMLRQDEHFATGAEIKEFYTSEWDADYYYESGDAVVQIEDEKGTWIAKPNGIYDLRDLGSLCWQGGGDPETKGKPEYMRFEEAFLAWKANRTYEVFVNGWKRTIKNPASYYDIVGDTSALVTYFHAPAPKESGSLAPGESIKVQNGTVFDAVIPNPKQINATPRPQY